MTVELTAVSKHWVVINNDDQCRSSAELNRQIKAALGLKKIPVICLNEVAYQLPYPFAERLANRLSNILAGIQKSAISQVIFAYHPQWIVGPLDRPQSWQMVINIRLIRDVLKDLYGQTVSRQVKIVLIGSQTGSITDKIADEMDFKKVRSCNDKQFDSTPCAK